MSQEADIDEPRISSRRNARLVDRDFGRDRADLGPTHAAQVAAEDVDRYGTHRPLDRVLAELRQATRPPMVSRHRRLDERTNDTYRLVVLFLAYTGVRFGELAALRVRGLDLVRRRAAIS